MVPAFSRDSDVMIGIRVANAIALPTPTKISKTMDTVKNVDLSWIHCREAVAQELTPSINIPKTTQNNNRYQIPKR